MKTDKRRLFLSLLFPDFFLFILYMIQFLQYGMEYDFTHLGIYPMEKRGVFGIFAHPLIHTGIKHLYANTFPLLFLMWALFYFYKDLGTLVFFFVWIAGGILTFIIGKPGWHVGASGIIYALAFFLFFSGILRKHIPLIASSLLVTFIYGGLVWNMFPFFAKMTTSWEGHLSGAISGTIAAILFRNKGPQRPEPFTDEEGEMNDDNQEDTNFPQPENDGNGNETSQTLNRPKIPSIVMGTKSTLNIEHADILQKEASPY